MIQALNTVFIAKSPLIIFPLVKLPRLGRATPRATATLTETTVPMDTASATATLTTVLLIAMDLEVVRLQVLVTF